MKRMYKLTLITIACLMIFILATGCTKNNDTEPDVNPDEIEQTDDVESEDDSNDIDEEVDTDDTETDEEVIDEDPDQPTVIFDSEGNYTLLLGAETFTELTGDKNFVDQAEEGNEYLVVYLEMGNKRLADDYIHYNYVTSTVDGEEINTTFLLNNPNNYNTILTNIPGETAVQGYLVYQVPVGWENITVTYTGWGTEEDEIFTFELTPEDLKEVDPYVEPILY